MPIYSPYILPQRRARDIRFMSLVLAWIIMTILSVMLLGMAISSWRATNREWSQPDKSGIPARYNLQVNQF